MKKRFPTSILRSFILRSATENGSLPAGRQAGMTKNPYHPSLLSFRT
ncbi:MAG: hypothetical protein L0956_06800 [Candidatus Mariimomonas ferrooxydans]